MHQFLEFCLIAALLFSHLVLWVLIFNRMHATPFPRKLIKVFEKLIFLAVLAVPALFLWQHGSLPGLTNLMNDAVGSWPWIAYAIGCICVAIFVVSSWLYRKTTFHFPTSLLSNHSETIDLVSEIGSRPVGDWQTGLLTHLPGNEILQLQINEKHLQIERLNPALDGLTIAHLSDLHMTGKITQPFFDYVVSKTNELQPDLIAITGDIVDKPHCIDWIPDTLGRLQSRFGIYYVLGNHDIRVDVARLRGTLNDAGMIDLGGRCRMLDFGQEPILIAGNERPWFRPLPNMADHPFETDAALRILLAHTPDQIRWGQRHRFDLMLAGHTHGGQIRFPFIGAVVSPSHYGVKYAGGLFEEPPTLMHVSRGLSGVEPVRFNCLPELTLLRLTAANKSSQESAPSYAVAAG